MNTASSVQPPTTLAPTVSAPTKINMDLVRRDSAVGFPSAGSTTPPSTTTVRHPLSTPPDDNNNNNSSSSSSSSSNSRSKNNGPHESRQHCPPRTDSDVVPATGSKTASAKSKKKNKKKSKCPDVSIGLSSTQSDSGDNPTKATGIGRGTTTEIGTGTGAGQHPPLLSDDELSWLESAVVRSDTAPTGKKSKSKKKPANKKIDLVKVVLSKNPVDEAVTTGVSTDDGDSNVSALERRSGNKIEATTERLAEEAQEHTPTMDVDSLAFIEDDSFMNNSSGTSNWADDMADLDDKVTCITDQSQSQSSTAPSTIVAAVVPTEDMSCSLQTEAKTYPSAYRGYPDTLRGSQPPQDARFYPRPDTSTSTNTNMHGRRFSHPDQNFHHDHQQQMQLQNQLPFQPRPPRPPRLPRPSRSQADKRSSHYQAETQDRFEHHQTTRKSTRINVGKILSSDPLGLHPTRNIIHLILVRMCKLTFQVIKQLWQTQLDIQVEEEVL
ncbi:hypothetical protein BG004_005564 [Podila humilis]|nr:hypothetical protein BG004_005564 [Podila humilis]